MISKNKNGFALAGVSTLILLLTLLSLATFAPGCVKDRTVQLIGRKAVFLSANIKNAPSDPDNTDILTVAFANGTGRFAAGIEGETAFHAKGLGTFKMPPATVENGVSYYQTLDVYSDLSNVKDLQAIKRGKYGTYGMAKNFKTAGLVETGEPREGDAEILIDTGQSALGSIPVNIMTVTGDSFTMIGVATAGAYTLNEGNNGSPIVQIQGGEKKLVGIVEKACYVQPAKDGDRVWAITAAKAQAVLDEMNL